MGKPNSIGTFFIINDGVDSPRTIALLTEMDDQHLTEPLEKKRKWLAVDKIQIDSHMQSMMDSVMLNSAAVKRLTIHSHLHVVMNKSWKLDHVRSSPKSSLLSSFILYLSCK